MDQEPEAEDDQPDWLRRTVFLLFALFFVVFAGGLTAAVWVVYIWPRPDDALLTRLVHGHFPAVVGLPTVGFMSFLVVWAFRQTTGPMMIKVPGIELRGSAGPVLLWSVCVLLVSYAMTITWQLDW